MSMNVHIEEVGSNSLDRVNKLLAGIKDGVFSAAYNALKRAGDTGKTQAGRYAAEEYTITKSKFMNNVRMTARINQGSGGHIHAGKDSGGAGSAVSLNIEFAGRVLPLLEFNTKYSRGGMLTTQVKRNGGASTLRHAFAERVFGPVAVFERVGSPRFPVQQLYGPSTAHMMQNEAVIEKMDETIRSTYEKRMEHEITRMLNGWGGRS